MSEYGVVFNYRLQRWIFSVCFMSFINFLFVFQFRDYCVKLQSKLCIILEDSPFVEVHEC